jgi:GNAT superfamily N-acetyltransferase
MPWKSCAAGSAIRWFPENPDMQEIICRPAKAAEQECLVDFIQAMAMESENQMLDSQVLRQGVAAVFTNPALGSYWMIQLGDQGIGSLLITVEWSDWHNAPYWWLQSVYLVPAYRGQGLMQQLISILENEGRAQGVRELRLYVDEANGRAIGAYDKSGFTSGHYRLMTKAL